MFRGFSFSIAQGYLQGVRRIADATFYLFWLQYKSIDLIAIDSIVALIKHLETEFISTGWQIFHFKVDAVQYYHDHRDLGLIGCAHNLGISQQTLSRWQKQLRDNGEMPYRGSGNYASDEAKEIARLKRELRDAKDAINVLKKAISILDK